MTLQSQRECLVCQHTKCQDSLIYPNNTFSTPADICKFKILRWIPQAVLFIERYGSRRRGKSSSIQCRGKICTFLSRQLSSVLPKSQNSNINVTNKALPLKIQSNHSEWSFNSIPGLSSYSCFSQ